MRKQVECGVEIVTDGELSKPGFFGISANASMASNPVRTRSSSFQQEVSFPEYYAQYFKEAMMGGAILPIVPVVCIGPVKYKGEAKLQVDIANVKAAAKAAGVPDHQVFLPATAPSGVGLNEHYRARRNTSTPWLRAEQGISGDRRGRHPAAGGRSVSAGHLLRAWA